MGISDEYVFHRTGSPYTVGKNTNTKLTETIHLNATQTFTLSAAKQRRKRYKKNTFLPPFRHGSHCGVFLGSKLTHTYSTCWVFQPAALQGLTYQLLIKPVTAWLLFGHQLHCPF